MVKKAKTPAALHCQKTVGRILSEARVGQRLSQEDLAVMMGHSQSWIALLEAGQRQPGLCDFLRLAKILAIPDDVLLHLRKGF